MMGSSASSSAVMTQPDASIATTTVDAVRPFDWYESPLYYDMIFQEDTPVETRMLRLLAKRWVTTATIDQEEEDTEATRAAQDAVLNQLAGALDQLKALVGDGCHFDGQLHPIDSSSSLSPAVVESNAQSNHPFAYKRDSQRLHHLTKDLEQMHQELSPEQELQPTSSSSNHPPRTLLCLEPACGSGRLMLSLLTEKPDPEFNVRWKVVGFDLSPGAIEFAQKEYAVFKNKMLLIQRQQAARSNTLNHAGSMTAASRSTPSSAPSESLSTSTSTLPDFTAFTADMTHFTHELQQHLPLPAPSSPPLLFDFGHCLVSSLKHLLQPQQVFHHFEQMHQVMKTDGIYVVAFHLHTMEGRSHLDGKVVYGSSANNSAADETTTAASSSIQSTHAVVCDPEEIDDAFESVYTRGDTSFKAELITYMPDPATMIEKMIARVQLNDPTSTSAASSSSTSSKATSSGGGVMQTDMSLRVYTLSSVHTLLCSISPMFSLESCLSYSDIYLDEWNPTEFELTYPYPTPSLEQLQSPAHPHPTHPFIITDELMWKNWNTIYPTNSELKDEWEDIDAIILVLKRKPIDAV